MTPEQVIAMVMDVVAQIAGTEPKREDALQGGRLSLDSLDFAEIIAVLDGRLEVDGLHNLRARTIGELADHYVSAATG